MKEDPLTAEEERSDVQVEREPWVVSHGGGLRLLGSGEEGKLGAEGT